MFSTQTELILMQNKSKIDKTFIAALEYEGAQIRYRNQGSIQFFLNKCSTSIKKMDGNRCMIDLSTYLCDMLCCKWKTHNM